MKASHITYLELQTGTLSETRQYPMWTLTLQEEKLCDKSAYTLLTSNVHCYKMDLLTKPVKQNMSVLLQHLIGRKTCWSAPIFSAMAVFLSASQSDLPRV